MKTRSMWVAVLLVTILVLMVGVAGAMPGSMEPEAIVAEKINYQGRLTNPGGEPLSGTYSMRFQLWSAVAGGTLWYDSGDMSVNVDYGLFKVELAPYQTVFDGRELWLSIQIAGEQLSPRQELLPVPYANSLRPGAVIAGDSAVNWILKVSNSHSPATGAAIWGNSATGTAIYGYSTGGYGLYGYSNSGNALKATSNTKTAGVFYSGEGYGIQVTTNGTDHWDHAGYFRSNWGYGIYAESTENYGVVGEGTVAGVRGRGESQGVSGSSTNGDGVAGWSSELAGVYGSSQNYYGVEGNTWKTDNNYGLFTYDNLYSANIHSAGAIMNVAQNGGHEPLEPGDVVVFAGMAPATEAGGQPIIQVAKASAANSTAVAGVVYSRYEIEATRESRRTEGKGSIANLEITPAGPAASGEYLLLVVQGPAQVKASALSSAVLAGDLLSSAGEAGYAAKTPEIHVEGMQIAAPGTVLGKALESLDADTGMIYVFVTLQ